MNDQKASPPKDTNTYPTTLADLQFTSQPLQSNFYRTLDVIRKSNLSISNRIGSILEDAIFVEALHDFLCDQRLSVLGHYSTGKADAAISQASWPLVPNERSGSWPLDPHIKLESQKSFLCRSSHCTGTPKQDPVSAYFKSTDGHINQWTFSKRRLNLPVLDLLGHAGGAVVVDTTRRGKRYPDALRRTVPIWCAVWNRVLFPGLISTGVNDFQRCNLDDSEVSQIETRLPRFVDELKTLNLDIDSLRAMCKRPIRCVWIHAPESPYDMDEAFRSVGKAIANERNDWQAKGVEVSILVCCSASRPIYGTEGNGTGYIQGAGDDAEAWSQGLNAKLLWQHKDELIRMTDQGDEALRLLIDRIVIEDKNSSHNGAATRISNTSIYINARNSADDPMRASQTLGYDLVIDCNASCSPTSDTAVVEHKDHAYSAITLEREDSVSKILALNLKEGKLGSKGLDLEIAKLRDYLSTWLSSNGDLTVLVVCSSGRDLSVGVALALICLFCSSAGGWLRQNDQQQVYIDKTFIRQRLAWITSSKPDANPSRATLQAVNRALMS